MDCLAQVFLVGPISYLFSVLVSFPLCMPIANLLGGTCRIERCRKTRLNECKRQVTNVTETVYQKNASVVVSRELFAAPQYLTESLCRKRQEQVPCRARLLHAVRLVLSQKGGWCG